MEKHPQSQKEVFWQEFKEVKLNRNVYRVIGWFVYPFIRRTETRRKHYSGEGGWLNKRLWYMLNDDELRRYEVDYDIKMVAKKMPWLPLNTKLGGFVASYWFNALRNAGYNYLLSHNPVEAEGDYANQEILDNNIYKNGEKVNPLLRAEWVVTDEEIDFKESKIGSGEVWFNPQGIKTISNCRWSRAYIKRFLFWNIYITHQKGEFGDTYDTIFKVVRVKKESRKYWPI